MLVGDASGRPIDLLLKNLGNILRDLRTAATSPSEAPQANSDLQVQVSNLKAIAPSLPSPFSALMKTAASGFDSDVVNSARNLLSQALGEVTQSCKLVVEGRYPFVRGADREVGLVDFGKIFGPNGVMDAYLNNYLDKYVNRRARRIGVGGQIRSRAACPSVPCIASSTRPHIRDAFFASGGSQPSFALTVTPPALRPNPA